MPNRWVMVARRPPEVPRLVVMMTTPLAALEPYRAEAEAPLSTSMLSMSFVFRSAMRLTWSSWVEAALDPAAGEGHGRDAVGDGDVADDDPVDDEQRLGLAGDGRDAAQPDLQAAARRARVGLHVGPRQLGLDGAVDGLGRHPVEVLGAHHRGAVGQVLLGDDRRALGEHDVGDHRR